MQLYNEIIKELFLHLDDDKLSHWNYDKAKIWEDYGHNELVLSSDAAYELGGSNHSAVSFSLVSSAPLLSISSNKITKNNNDSVYLLGPDLCKIKSDSHYARIAILEIDDIKDENVAYKALNDIDFVKYRIFPKGYMLRASPSTKREQVRLDKSAIKNGISFENIGANFISKYKENAFVKSVKLFYITEPNFDYKLLEKLASDVNKITKTLDHIMEGLQTNCHSCSLKAVCDEVEGMKELHFKVNSNKKA